MSVEKPKITFHFLMETISGALAKTGGIALSLVFLLAASAAVFADDSEVKRGVDNASLVGTDSSAEIGQIREVLCLGNFAADSVDAAMNKSFFDETGVEPVIGTTTANLQWGSFTSQIERFVVSRMPLTDAGNCFATYFSFWIYTPAAVTPDTNFELFYYAALKGKLWLNGKPYEPTTTEQVDVRLRYLFPNMALNSGWNHFLIKLAGRIPGPTDPPDSEPSLALRVRCADANTFNALIVAPAVNPETTPAAPVAK